MTFLMSGICFSGFVAWLCPLGVWLFNFSQCQQNLYCDWSLRWSSKLTKMKATLFLCFTEELLPRILLKPVISCLLEIWRKIFQRYIGQLSARLSLSLSFIPNSQSQMTRLTFQLPSFFQWPKFTSVSLLQANKFCLTSSLHIYYLFKWHKKIHVALRRWTSGLQRWIFVSSWWLCKALT